MGGDMKLNSISLSFSTKKTKTQFNRFHMLHDLIGGFMLIDYKFNGFNCYIENKRSKMKKTTHIFQTQCKRDIFSLDLFNMF